jgi:hypothetical protein
LGQFGRSAWPMDPIPLPNSELRQNSGFGIIFHRRSLPSGTTESDR